MIAAATGGDITATELSRVDASGQFPRFVPAGEAEVMLRFLNDADDSAATDIVPQTTGCPATRFEVRAADYAVDF